MRPGKALDISNRSEQSLTFCFILSIVFVVLLCFILVLFLQVRKSLLTPDELTIAAPTPTATPVPPVSHFLPLVGNPVSQPRPSSAGQLAFLKDGDIFLKDVSTKAVPCGTWMECTLKGPKPEQLTRNWKAIRFAWSPDGQKLAAFDGRAVRIKSIDSQKGGELRIGLRMPERQIANIPALMWTPDQSHILLWNIDNPRDEVPAGWFLVDPQKPNQTEFYPGRVGNVLALADGSLILTQVEMQNQSLKTIGLWRYDPVSSDMQAYNLENLNKQGGLGILNTEVMQELLTGTAHVECGYYPGAPDSLNLGLSSRLRSTTAKEMPYDFLLAPQGGRILATRGAACGGSIPAEWLASCWPGGGPDDYKMYLWDPKSGEEKALVAGMFADWSPGGGLIAFQSCLAVTPFEQRVSVDAEPPWIFVMDGTGNNRSVLPISQGFFPAWRPVP